MIETAKRTEERVAIVTGGTRGIGRAVSLALREAGVRVAANYHSNDAAAETFTRQTDIPGYRWDVADFHACAAGVQRIADELGPVSILVNNAGITRDATISKMTREMWDEVIRVNLGGCFNMCKAVFAGMSARRFGRIVNIGSINGRAGQFGQINYSASKSALHGFTKALAMEGGKVGVTVNLVEPGYTQTDMTAAVPSDIMQSIIQRIPVGRLGSASEIARGVLFLCAEEAGFLTGSTISVNGGHSMY